MANEKDKQKQATSQKGTTYTQVNDSTYNWNAPTGYGVIHLDPNSGGPWGTYHVYQGKGAGPDVEKKLSEDGLKPHLQNINTLDFKYPGPWWAPIKEYVAPRWNRLIDKAKIEKHGGYLNKYALGGAAQQPNTEEEEKGLMTLIDSAYREITSGKPGDNFVYVAQLMQDAEAMVKLDALKAKDPSIEDKLNVIEEAAISNSMYMKKGGCTRKKTTKVKKGAKGCVPCKKLMRVGGKLVNILTDCEGNIIHKHQIGGWIRKGSTGFNTSVLNSDFTKAKTGTTGATGQVHYYQDANGRWLQQSWQDGAGGNPGSWSTGTSEYDANAFQEWRNANANNIFKTGFTANWDNYSGTFDTQENAIAALGQTEFDKGWTSKTVRGVTGEKGNTWLGTEAKDPTAQDYVNQYGLQGALQKESRLRAARLLQAKNDKRAARRSAWENGLVGSGQLKSIRTAWKNQRDAIKSQHKAQAANLINTYTSKNPTFVTTPDITVGQSTTAQSPVNTTSTQTGTDDYKVLKNGGWLTKFQDGGHMDYETKSNISGTTWEQRVSRDNTGAIYRYNPGRTSHVVTLQTTGLPAINPNRFVKHGEERYYLADPKTGRVIKIEGPTIDQRVEEVVPIVNSSSIEDQISPSQDIFIFPGGFTKVTPAAPVQKPGGSKESKKPEKNIEGPKQEVPTQPNDNTSTSGSKTPGNIRQGNYPVYESLPAPDGYDPSNEWIEERDQVNGQVRVTWRNKKTGEIRRVKPYKHGGWLNQF